MGIQYHREGDKQRNRIYKYLGVADTRKENDRFRYIKKLLETGELYLSKPRNFNDLFDSLFDFSFIGKEKDIEAWFRSFFSSEEVDDNIKDQFWKILQLEDVNKYALAIAELEKYHKINRDYGLDQMSACVCCFADTWDVSPMWGHYASSNSGICIGLEVEYVPRPTRGSFLALDFQESAPDGSESTNWPLLPIIYSDERPAPFEIFEQNQHYKIQRGGEFLLTKHTAWQYEQERRILSVPKVGQTDPPEILHLEGNVIKEVMFGHRMSIEDREMLTCCLDGRDVELYQIKLPKNSFQLERERLRN